MGEVRRYRVIGGNNEHSALVNAIDHDREIAARDARIAELEYASGYGADLACIDKVLNDYDAPHDPEDGVSLAPKRIRLLAEKTLALRERVRELVSKLENLEGEQSVVRESLLAVLAHDTNEDLSTRPLAYLAGSVEALVNRQRPIVDAAVNAAKASLGGGASVAHGSNGAPIVKVHDGSTTIVAGGGRGGVGF